MVPYLKYLVLNFIRSSIPAIREATSEKNLRNGLMSWTRLY